MGSFVVHKMTELLNNKTEYELIYHFHFIFGQKINMAKSGCKPDGNGLEWTLNEREWHSLPFKRYSDPFQLRERQFWSSFVSEPFLWPNMLSYLKQIWTKMNRNVYRYDAKCVRNGHICTHSCPFLFIFVSNMTAYLAIEMALLQN